MSKYQICEFGGNTVEVDANTPYDAVKSVFDTEKVSVFPDGYIHINDQPFGWVTLQ